MLFNLKGDGPVEDCAEGVKGKENSDYYKTLLAGWKF